MNCYSRIALESIHRGDQEPPETELLRVRSQRALVSSIRQQQRPRIHVFTIGSSSSSNARLVTELYSARALTAETAKDSATDGQRRSRGALSV